MKSIASAFRYWNTIRYLRPVQVYGRVMFKVAKPRPQLGPAPTRALVRGRWVEPLMRTASLLDRSTFSYLGVTATLAEVGWDGPQMPKLWRYNQHYFDDLNSIGAHERTTWHAGLISKWIRSNPPGQGSGWEPYPTALRIVNWLKWMHGGKVLSAETVDSLAVQTRWLVKRLENHLLGNHLFANGKALIFAGLAFTGREPERWLQLGLQIIERELPEQILADGGNFERSTMYHAIFLEDLLDLLNVAGTYDGRINEITLRQWNEVAAKMLGWLGGMSHPDGKIGFFNDAAFGIASDIDDQLAYASRLGLSAPHVVESCTQPACRIWPDSGYVRLDSVNAVALLDVGPVGPDYLPGHAHADTLSFELSLYGQRLVVNGGTSRYGQDGERERERATSSHSTVEIDGKDSSEVWSGFRVARRAYPFDFLADANDSAVSIRCAHDGYHRLPGKPTHRRTWVMEKSRLTISDQVIGRCEVAVARYIMHPDVAIRERATGGWELIFEDGRRCVFEVTHGKASIERSFYAPMFGQVVETKCITVRLQENLATISIDWN